MRHIVSLLAGLIIAPIAWLLIGAGVTGLDPNGFYQDVAGKPSALIALAMFITAGILLGLLTVNRVSPAGAVTTAIIFLAAFALYRFTSFNFLLPDALQSAKIPARAAEIAGSSGTVLVIAGLMGLSIFVPSRWRGKDNDDDRVVDTASLADDSGPHTGHSEAIDPFAPSQARQGNPEQMHGSNNDVLATSHEERSPGFDTADTAAQRPYSPYAGDEYQADQYQYGGYRQTDRYPRESQQPPQFPPPDYNREPGYDPRRQYYR